MDLTALLVQLMQERDSRAEQLRERLASRECSIIQPFFVQLNPSFTVSCKKCLTAKGSWPSNRLTVGLMFYCCSNILLNIVQKLLVFNQKNPLI